MFEQLFKMAPTVTRNKAAPYPVEHERYFDHFSKQGYAHTHQTIIWDAASNRARIEGLLHPNVGEEQIRAATERATRRHRNFRRIR